MFDEDRSGTIEFKVSLPTKGLVSEGGLQDGLADLGEFGWNRSSSARLVSRREVDWTKSCSVSVIKCLKFEEV